MSSSDNEQPPVFGKWSSWYWLVMGVLLVQIALYSVMTFILQ